MKLIEIKTTHNVTISYELASLLNRIFAWFIDMVIIGVSYVLLFTLAGLILSSVSEWVMAWYLILLPLVFFYTLIWEWSTGGSTPGKMAMKIKVVKMNGQPLSFTDHLLRWSFRMVDIAFSFGSIAAILINSTEWSQRLGDIVANTVVIRLNSSLTINLEDILKIKSLKEYTPSYPQVKDLEEEDMLLIKRVVERSRLYQNEAHVEALNLAAQKMARHLKLEEVPPKPSDFLNTCIRDYIVLTR